MYPEQAALDRKLHAASVFDRLTAMSNWNGPLIFSMWMRPSWTGPSRRGTGASTKGLSTRFEIGALTKDVALYLQKLLRRYFRFDVHLGRKLYPAYFVPISLPSSLLLGAVRLK
jgi:hypothetical protein